MSEKLHCICCNKEMDNILYDSEHPGMQPVDGLAFNSTGHYGTTFFDPMDGTYIEVAICDECLVKADAEGKIFYSRKPKEYSVEETEELAELISRSRVVKRKTIGDDDWEIVDGPSF